MYHKFVKVVKLTVNELAKGTALEQEQFRTILTNLRDGNSKIDDWNILLSKTPSHIPDLESFRNDSARLSFGNEKVAQDNFQSLKELGYPITTLNAKHNNSTAAKLSSDDMGSLQPKFLLSKGAKVMLTRNLWKSVGLCNGTLGKVLHIIYKDNDCPRSLPIAIIVQFEEGYTGPTFCKNIPNFW